MPVSYAVIKLDCLNQKTEILDTFAVERDAIQFVGVTVNNAPEYQDEKWYRKIYDSETSISVYRCNWFFAKTLIYRYFIKEFSPVIYGHEEL